MSASRGRPRSIPSCATSRCAARPGAGSAALVRELHRARVAVVLLTGYPKEAIESLGLRVPVYTKPVTLDELLEAVPRPS